MSFVNVVVVSLSYELRDVGFISVVFNGCAVAQAVRVCDLSGLLLNVPNIPQGETVRGEPKKV